MTLGSPPSCASIHHIVASLSGLQPRERGPLRTESMAMGMSSASGRRATSAAKAPKSCCCPSFPSPPSFPFSLHSWVTRGNRPAGNCLEKGRSIQETARKRPSGEGEMPE